MSWTLCQAMHMAWCHPDCRPHFWSDRFTNNAPNAKWIMFLELEQWHCQYTHTWTHHTHTYSLTQRHRQTDRQTDRHMNVPHTHITHAQTHTHTHTLLTCLFQELHRRDAELCASHLVVAVRAGPAGRRLVHRSRLHHHSTGRLWWEQHAYKRFEGCR